MYFIYFWFEDSISFFSVYKLGVELLASPQLYLILLATVSVSVLLDGVYINLMREFKTPLSVLFNSIEKNKAYSRQERDVMFRKIINSI